MSKVEDDHVPTKEVEREPNGGVHEGKLRIEGVLHNEKAAANQNSLVQENGSEIIEVEVEVDNSPGVSAKDHKEDRLDSSALINGSGNEIEIYNDDDDDDDESENMSLYSGSDRAESSSVDGSMADMVPMLDEIHPLIDNGEFDEDTEIHGEVEDDGVDDNEDDDDDDEEEEAQGVKEDESKSAIKWTEDDQKNLIDLGTLELERNQRLENLIARRRAWQSSKTMAEKNLIDFESAEFPFNVAPLSVTRRNPFEFPYDSTNPGSAPSILLPTRNPSDLPFESKEEKKEEKTDSKGDGSEQQCTTFHQKEVFFRRHESFSLGPSSLGFVKQDNQDLKWRPVFIPERFVSEGRSSYSSFSRQSSGVGDSKVSSIPDPDSESVSSVEQDFSKEKEIISNPFNTSNLVVHGSRSTEDLVSEEMVQIERKDVEHVGLEITLGQQVENHSETESSSSETEEQDSDVELELNTSETHLENDPVEEENSSRSSLSSVSEVDEKNSSVGENDDGPSSLEANSGDHINGVVDENLPEEPVYDSSPRAAGNLLSLSSICSDTRAEILEIVKPPELVEMAILVEDEEPMVHTEKDENSHSEKD